MEFSIVNERLSQWHDIIEHRLDELTRSETDSPYELMYEAVRYSLLNGGKRIRPVLTLEFCRAAGGAPEDALDCACAVEMIHSYSLIHDDMPCMDDDDMRRGRPSCHKVFGEAVAMLAGDALQAFAAQTIADCTTAPADRLLRCVSELSRLAGSQGMIGGQLLDIQSEGKTIDLDTLRAMDEGKTCALLESACVMGCIIAGADGEILSRARMYAHELGLAFQIIDDILDVTSDTETLGKPVASDVENEKSNYVTKMGLDGARRFAKLHTESAISALEPLGECGEFLRQFALYLLNRIN